MNPPILLIVGNLPGVGKKDAREFVRGLAERQCSSLEATRFRIERDKEADAYLYEIQEGGGDARLTAIREALGTNERIGVALADGWAEVLNEDGEIYTIVHREDPDDSVVMIEAQKPGGMEPYQGDGRALRKTGNAVLAIGSIGFVGALAAYTLTATAPMPKVSADQSVPLPIEALTQEQEQLGHSEYIKKFEFDGARYEATIGTVSDES
ncbi:hypothetical protein TK90_2851 (plasmid) [Thioalkalivibrio sp. K90mix]|uniref:hypothetical protein n=1 Tax=Thioalkalivibrio sp. (strain K90mix) TaxID=396595 RepID=UPI000195A8C6|nr:hypothetical protein [Thioalkalivibrio sp. K90mix]ADC73335.1 hypothetical protein TK90_2851 [Thioalkalivibrio sp. K90mix]